MCCHSLQFDLQDLRRGWWWDPIIETNSTQLTESTEHRRKSMSQGILFTHLHQGWERQALQIYQLYADDTWATDNFVRYLVLFNSLKRSSKLHLGAEWKLPASFNMTPDQAVADKSVMMDYYRTNLLEDAYARLLRGEIRFDYPLADLPDPMQDSTQGNDGQSEE